MSEDFDPMWEYMRDMMSPADGPDLTDAELLAMFKEGAKMEAEKDELARLRRIEELARAVVEDENADPYINSRCVYCWQLVPDHADNCPWAQLQAELGEGD